MSDNNYGHVIRRVTESNNSPQTATIIAKVRTTIEQSYDSSDSNDDGSDGERGGDFRETPERRELTRNRDRYSDGDRREYYTDTLSSPDDTGSEMTHRIDTSTDRESNWETRSELGQAKYNLEKVSKELENEKAIRIAMDAKLQHERESLISPEDLKALKEMESTMEKLKEEKDSMSKALMISVKESAKIAEELESLREELDDVKLEEENLKKINDSVTTAYEKLSKEINSKVEQRTRMGDEKNELLGKITHVCERIKQITQDITDAHAKIKEIESIKMSLTNSLRRIEMIDVAMSCLSAALRRTDHVSEKLHTAIVSGNVDNINPEHDDGYDSEEDAPNTTSATHQYEISKPIFKKIKERCSDIVEAFRRFTVDEASREEKAAQDHIARVAQMKSQVEEVRQDLENKMSEERKIVDEIKSQRQNLLKLLKDLELKAHALEKDERVVAVISESIAANRSSSPNRNDEFMNFDDTVVDIGSLPSITSGLNLDMINSETDRRPLTVIERIQELIVVRQSEKSAIDESNSKWKKKLDVQKEDFLSVKKLKRAYRDLETQKIMMGVNVREMEDRNRELKLEILKYNDNYVSLPII